MCSPVSRTGRPTWSSSPRRRSRSSTAASAPTEFNCDSFVSRGCVAGRRVARRYAMTETMDPDTSTAKETFESLDPASGDVIDTFSIDDAGRVDDVVRDARVASEWWGALGFRARKERLRTWESVIAREVTELAELVHRENGK